MNEGAKVNRRKKWIIVGGVAAAAVIALGGILAVTGNLDSILHPQESEAISECQSAVADELISPSSASFSNVTTKKGGVPDLVDVPTDALVSMPDVTVFVVTGKVDGDNGFGASLRSTFRCRAFFSEGNFVETSVGAIKPA